MKKTYKANNISCGNCAKMIKASLADEFGEVEVNLEVQPKEVTVEIENDSKEEKFKLEMKELGFDVIEE